MSGVALTGDDFQEAMSRAGVEIDLDAADSWFDSLQSKGLLDLEAIYSSVVAANSIEEEVELLIVSMTNQIIERDLHDIICSERLRDQFDLGTLPAPRDKRTSSMRL